MINNVVLVGRLTKDIEVKKTPSGLSVASFTVAVNRRYAKDGERKADFINCVAWRQSADFLGQYAKKGTLVGVEGNIQTRNYDNAEGRKVYITEVVCDSCRILESRNASSNHTVDNNQLDENDFSLPPVSDNSENSDEDVELNISVDDMPF